MARDDIMKGRYAQTLWDMTARRPLEAITAREIINCTGTARQTFYDHFSSKQALAGYVLEQWLSSATQDCPQRQTWLKSLELITTRAAERPLFFKGFAGLGAGPSSSQVLARAFSTCILIGKKRMHPKCYHAVSCRLLRLRHRWRVCHLDNGERTERSLCGKPHHVRGDAFGTETIPRRSCAHSTLQRKRDGYRPGEPLLPLPDVSCHPWIRTNRRADRASSRRTNAKRFAPVQHRRKRRRGEIRSHTCLPTARSRAQFLP